MLIYLDNCCYNRPYDDETQMRISLETQAKLYIQDLIKKHELQLASSFMLLAENDANPYDIKRSMIRSFINSHTNIFVGIDNLETIKQMAFPIMETGIKQADAYHLACAVFTHCDYFITTDKRILRYHTDKLKIQNPTVFLAELEE